MARSFCLLLFKVIEKAVRRVELVFYHASNHAYYAIIDRVFSRSRIVNMSFLFNVFVAILKNLFSALLNMSFLD